MEEKFSSDKYLVCHHQFKKEPSQLTFIDIGSKSDCESSIFNQSLTSFSAKANVQISAACNGLLLLSIVEGKKLHYSLYDPLTKQQTEVSQSCLAKQVIRSGLAFLNNNYHILQLVTTKFDASSDLHIEIFSSESGKWKKHLPLTLSRPCLAPTIHENSGKRTPTLFSNGAVYWELGNFLLIYGVKNEDCELIEFPNYESQKSTPFGQCLWESKGRIQYCYTDSEGIHTWVLLEEQDHEWYNKYYSYDRDKFRWKLVHTVTHHNLESKNPQFFSCYGRPNFISPCAIDEDKETLYFQLMGVIFAYDLRRQILEKINHFPFSENELKCSNFFNFDFMCKVNLDMESVEVINLPAQKQIQKIAAKAKAKAKAKAMIRWILKGKVIWDW